MRLPKEDLLKLGGLAVSGVAFVACGGVYLPDQGTLTKVVEALAPNFAHQFLSGMDYRRFREFLITPHPDNLNHDLDRLMKDALVQSFHHMETAYLSRLERENAYSQWEKVIKRPFEKFRSAFRALRRSLMRELDYQEEYRGTLPEDEKIGFDLENWLLTDQHLALPKLIEELFNFPELDDDAEWEELRNFFTGNLPRIYDLSFREALKDERNLKAYKAFQMYVMELIVEQNVQTHRKLDEVRATLLALQHGLQTSPMLKLDTALEESLGPLRTDINKGFENVIRRIELSETIIFDKIDNATELVIQTISGKLAPDRHLTEPPFMPEVFLGREDDLEDVRRMLFEETHLLLLINGNGGIGKTSMAAKYYHKYQHLYSHIAWVTRNTTIGDALLSLAPKLFLKFEQETSQKQRLELLLGRMASLDRPCLLVIDNANDPADLATYWRALRRCSNFHILLTTRITRFGEAKTKLVNGLPLAKARELFRRYYPQLERTEHTEFERLYLAVNGNTLVLELLAKLLHEANVIHNQYTLENLIADLQQKGVLALQYSTQVRLDYREFTRATPEAVISVLYDLHDLSEPELQLMAVFTVLPPEKIRVEILTKLLDAYDQWPTALLSLDQKGWVDFNRADKTVIVNPVVQEIVKNKNPELEVYTFPLLNVLSEELAYEGWSHREHGENPDFEEISLFIGYAENLLQFHPTPVYEKGLLMKRMLRHYRDYTLSLKAHLLINDLEELLQALQLTTSPDICFLLGESKGVAGDVYQSEGNMPEALRCFQVYNSLMQSLHDDYPQQISYKNCLGISFERLGDVYRSEGNMTEALRCFQVSNSLIQSLHSDYPGQVSYKNSLGVSFSKLGDVYQSEGNMTEALRCHKAFNSLMQSLHDNYPQQVRYKHNLGISFLKLGDVYASEVNRTEALRCFQVYNSLMQSLHDDYPQQVSYKNGLGISFQRLGDVYESEGNMTEALRCHRACNSLMQSLHDDYPQQVRYKHNLGISLSKLGDVHQSEGNMTEALRCFQVYNSLIQSLHDDYPQQISYKNGLGISFQHLGDVHQSEGNMTEALRCFKVYNSLMQSLHDDYPQQVRYKNSLGISFSNLGDVYRSEGNMTEALKCFEVFNSLMQSLHDDYPQQVRYKNNLGISFLYLGDVYRSEGKMTEALRCYQKYNFLMQSLHDDYPQQVSYKHHLGISFESLGDVYLSERHLAEALDNTRMYLEISKSLYAEYPDQIDHQYSLGKSLQLLGLVCVEMNEHGAAKAHYQEALPIFEDLVAKAPLNADYSKDLAWLKQKLRVN